MDLVETISPPDDLDDVVRAAAELVRATSSPPMVVRVRRGAVSVELRWPDGSRAAASGAAPAPTETPVPAADPAPAPATSHVTVTSPLVGTFYHAPEPGARPYAEPGALVTAGQQVGLVESMKLMNPIVTEVAGRVVEVLVHDGAPVQFGDDLVVIDPGATEAGDR
jgi:acetyl-CoA carboxylase biotin carboxyl carrier protein